jgi:hypothetical protein
MFCIINDGIDVAGRPAGRILALLTGDRDIHPGCQFNNPNPRSRGIKGAGVLERAVKFTKMAPVANSGALPRPIRVSDSLFLCHEVHSFFKT